MAKKDGCCGGACKSEGHSHHSHSGEDPLANLDAETQRNIQELQILEQNFQQLLMQKNAFSMEANETDYVVRELEKTSGEVSRIIGSSVVIKSTKEEVIKDMNNKKSLIEKRMKAIDEQEKKFSEKMNSLREEVMKKISG